MTTREGMVAGNVRYPGIRDLRNVPQVTVRWQGGVLRQLLQHIPAGLSAARLLATPYVVWLAWQGERERCCASMAASVLIDLADGILARRIGNLDALRRQRQIDGMADAAFSVAAPLSAYRLRPQLLWDERGAIALFCLCQGASLLACGLRFGRLPRYHTVAYKWSAGTLGLALAGRLAGGRLALGFRPAIGAMAAAHIEAAAISVMLEQYREPVRSLREARRASRVYSTRRGPAVAGR